jgi:NADH:ubiquinone oxidoreductase subunit 3 (subunit A)
MQNLTNKSDFRLAYEAGKQAVESRRRPFSIVRAIIFALLLAFAFEVSESLAVRYSLSGFEKTLLDFAFGFPIVLVLLIMKWRIPIKRNKTSRSA